MIQATNGAPTPNKKKKARLRDSELMATDGIAFSVGGWSWELLADPEIKHL
jgi:hypothetical protein